MDEVSKKIHEFELKKAFDFLVKNKIIVELQSGWCVYWHVDNSFTKAKYEWLKPTGNGERVYFEGDCSYKSEPLKDDF